jgi:hypothetical protein
MKDDHKAPEVCAACGAEVPPDAMACPECGADAQTGWNEEQRVYDGVDLPDNSFDHDEFIEREFGGSPGKSGRLILAVILIAIIVVIIIRAFSMS